MLREEEFERFLKYADTQRYSADERPIAWDAWLAAKHDAKPVVEVHQSKYHGYRDVHRIIHNGDVLYESTSATLAAAWIESNGYRLE